MQVRCSYCRHSFNLSRDYMAQALAESSKNKQKYHAVECINCRKVIKVPLNQMRRYVPQQEVESDQETS